MSVVAISHSSDEVANITVPLFAMLAIEAVYSIVWLKCGVVPAFFAAAALAFSPGFLSRPIILLTEMPFVALYVCALSCFFLGCHRNVKWFRAG